jgi:peptidoglycan/xylan/chitin deacetylase (PgdA/CDA1 family)
VTGRRLAILSYHKIGKPEAGGWSHRYDVPQPVFHRQLGLLQLEGWTFVSPDRVIAALTGEASLPERSALLTLDDGYRSLVDYALPVLSEYQCPGVVFVPTDHVGGHNSFDFSSRGSREALCDWDDLRRLEDAGIAVQSHGASHRAFSKLSPEAVAAELADSKAKIEQQLERPVTMLAYPYGDSGADPDMTADLLEQAGYAAAFVYGGRPFDPWQADRYRLERIGVGPDTDLRAELGGDMVG